ncbi:MAG TPA: hypothetical protein VN808_09090 [Stellaceae bacterium]|nr:hypothetical protein [Stellaceae bacterium]
MAANERDANSLGDFAVALRRNGLTIPEERREIMRDAVEKMQALLKVLDDPLAYEDEPAVLPRYDLGAKR